MKRAVSHPDLVVLGLLAEGAKHGYQIEERIERDNIRIWAKIGMSSIYHSLNKLEEKGMVASKTASSKRGAGKFVYSITSRGRSHLANLVSKALASRASVYSDRIAGLVFAPNLSGANLEGALSKSEKGVGTALRGIKSRRKEQTHPVADIVLEYYQAIFEAEKKALKRAKMLLGK